MTSAIPLEDLIHQALDRLALQERRTDALEAALGRIVPVVGSPRPVASPSDTPLDIPWPRRELPRIAASPADRIKELEARLLEAEERLRASSRLETVGRLVAGVAHDFNNLLTIISGHAEVIRAELAADSSLRDVADLIVSTAHTAAGVTRQLVMFGKPGQPDPCPVDANMAIRGVERTLGRLTGGRVGLELTLAASVPLIRVDPGQFDQVLLNLVVNARDAIPDAGTITVRTATTHVSPHRPGWPDDVAAGDYVVVTVTDTGTGMTEEVKSRIFDLFFTTKGSQGTGLGLSTVRDVVKRACGHIEVDSAPNWGTSVRVYWPVYTVSREKLRLVVDTRDS
jgi:signal transduction histidine kinase